ANAWSRAASAKPTDAAVASRPSGVAAANDDTTTAASSAPEPSARTARRTAPAGAAASDLTGRGEIAAPGEAAASGTTARLAAERATPSTAAAPGATASTSPTTPTVMSASPSPITACTESIWPTSSPTGTGTVPPTANCPATTAADTGTLTSAPTPAAPAAPRPRVRRSTPRVAAQPTRVPTTAMSSTFVPSAVSAPSAKTRDWTSSTSVTESTPSHGPTSAAASAPAMRCPLVPAATGQWSIWTAKTNPVVAAVRAMRRGVRSSRARYAAEPTAARETTAVVADVGSFRKWSGTCMSGSCRQQCRAGVGVVGVHGCGDARGRRGVAWRAGDCGPGLPSRRRPGRHHDVDAGVVGARAEVAGDRAGSVEVEPQRPEGCGRPRRWTARRGGLLGDRGGRGRPGAEAQHRVDDASVAEDPGQCAVVAEVEVLDEELAHVLRPCRVVLPWRSRPLRRRQLTGPADTTGCPGGTRRRHVDARARAQPPSCFSGAAQDERLAQQRGAPCTVRVARGERHARGARDVGPVRDDERQRVPHEEAAGVDPHVDVPRRRPAAPGVRDGARHLDELELDALPHVHLDPHVVAPEEQRARRHERHPRGAAPRGQ